MREADLSGVGCQDFCRWRVTRASRLIRPQ